jgi:CCR4-NOT transcription complex subunit 1
VAFIFNNLSLMNMSLKGEELKEKLPGEFTPWLAQYLVMKRASIEPNFHTLYSNFLEVVLRDDFYGEVLKETYNSIGVLLGSDKSIANFR